MAIKKRDTHKGMVRPQWTDFPFSGATGTNKPCSCRPSVEHPRAAVSSPHQCSATEQDTNLVCTRKRSLLGCTRCKQATAMNWLPSRAKRLTHPSRLRQPAKSTAKEEFAKRRNKKQEHYEKIAKDHFRVKEE